MMMRLFGTAVRLRISMLVRMNSGSGARPGIMRASEPVATMMFFASRVCVPEAPRTSTLPPPLQRGVARDALHLGALEQHLDALGVLVDDAVLAILDLGIIQARVLAVDAFLLRVDEALPDVGGLQQALGGDAAHQQAGAAELGLLLDERGLQTELAGANGSGVAAGTTPYHDQIVRHFFYSTCVTGSAAGAST